MATEAGWQADPTNRHEMRYWDGSKWTEHVADGGAQSTDVFEGAPESQVTSYGMNPSDQTVIWEGSKKSLTASATGGRLTAARYRVTKDAVHFEAGMLSTKAEMIPLWTITDVDLIQSMMQKARNLGDVRLHLDTGSANRFGQRVVKLESVEDPRSVRDLILKHANTVRQQVLTHQHDLEVQKRQAGAMNITVGGTPPAAATAPVDAADRSTAVISALKELASLRDTGVLSDEEFETEKAKLLNS